MKSWAAFFLDVSINSFADACLGQFSVYANKDHTRKKTANMGPPGDTGTGTLPCGVNKLNKKPEPEKNKRRDIDKQRKNENRDQCKNFISRMKKKISTHNPCNGTA